MIWVLHDRERLPTSNSSYRIRFLLYSILKMLINKYFLKLCQLVISIFGDYNFVSDITVSTINYYGLVHV